MFGGGRIEVIGVPGMPEVEAGHDIARLAADCARAAGLLIRHADIVVVAQKVVSKSEGRIVDINSVTSGQEAVKLAEECGKDPRVVELILQESKRIVRVGPGFLIVETHHGFICANAGIDASNVPGADFVTLLPSDPDASARGIRKGLAVTARADVAVVVSDSFNRPWRNGSINVALGVAGMAPVLDQRGQTDQFGRILRATVVSLADEVASAAQLVMGEVRGTPVALVRGVQFEMSDEGGGALLRPAAQDLFR